MRLLLVALLVASAVGASGLASAGPAPPQSVVGCDIWIAATARIPAEAAIVLDRVALPRGRYPWRLQRSGDRLFPLAAKWGAAIRAGTGEAVTISIARPWRRHAYMGWGNGRALSVRFLPCESSSLWVVYAGGFALKKRGCLPFDVQVGDRIQRVRIAFGRACTVS